MSFAFEPPCDWNRCGEVFRNKACRNGGAEARLSPSCPCLGGSCSGAPSVRKKRRASDAALLPYGTCRHYRRVVAVRKISGTTTAHDAGAALPSGSDVTFLQAWKKDTDIKRRVPHAEKNAACSFMRKHEALRHPCHGTRCGSRTRKSLRTRDFKSLAFTSFATRAHVFRISTENG